MSNNETTNAGDKELITMNAKTNKTSGIRNSKKSTKAHPAVAAAAFEALEDRRLFSVLTLNLTAGDDTVQLFQGPTLVRAVVNGQTHAYMTARVDGVVINGLDGSDRVQANLLFSKPITFNGGAGNDMLIPGRGNDVFNGGDDNDVMVRSPGSDTFAGGAGTDTMDYSGSMVGVNVTLDDVANDGVAGENDNIGSDVENVNGGYGNDTITGSAAANYLQGGGGTDTLNGMDGDDVLDGGVGGAGPYAKNTGDDVLNGGNGNDWLYASDYGNNTLNGGAGSDHLYGYSGNDTLDGGSGADFCYGGNGDDVIYGGSGDDYLDGQAGTDNVYGNYGPRSLLWVNPLPITFGSADAAPQAAAPGALINTTITPIDTIINPLPIDVLPIHPIDPYVLPPVDLTPVVPQVDPRLIDPVLTIRPIFVESDNDIVHGGDGNDRVRGDGGDDQVFGDAGDDFCYGDAGNDVIHGGDGRDNVYGGAGDDQLFGDAGDDVLVSIGGGQNDSNTGGDGLDSVWCDSEVSETDNNDFVNALIEGLAGTHHRVGGFQNVTNGTSSQTPSRELNGQNLIDPQTKGGVPYQNFSDRPLFGHLGPHKDDIHQGALADCYYLAGLSAVAKTDPNRIHESVVDLGDGTYAVQFFRNGTPEFYRVDGDLPAYSGGSPVYQKLGHDDSLWAAVMEKAFAFRRSGAGTYASIEYGGADTFDVLNLAHNNVMGGNGLDSLINIQNALASGKTVIAGTRGTVPSDCPCVGNHMYSIESVHLSYFDFLGTKIDTGSTITVRNPWHTDGAGNDGVNDGYVTMSAAQFFAGYDYAQSALA